LTAFKSPDSPSQAVGNDNTTVTLAPQRPGTTTFKAGGQASKGALGQLSEWAQRQKQLVGVLQQRIQNLINGP
jgi:hypothetical protein